MNSKKKLRFYLAYIYFFFIIWQIIENIFPISQFILPSPLNIVISFYQDAPTILFNSMYTIFEALVGVAISLILGVAIAIIMDKNHWINSIFSPIITISQTIPTIILAPLMAIILGYGVGAKIIIIVIICVFPIVVSTLEGFNSVDIEYLQLFQLMEANQYQTYKELKLPFALNQILNGLRISITYAYTSAIVAEYMGSEHGLGIYISRAYSSFRIDRVFAVTIFISLLTIMTIFLLERVKEKYLRKEIR